MASAQLPNDFREFLKLLNDHDVQYLLVGGHAVAYHGYPRATADMDVWVAITPKNAEKLVHVFREFGMDDPSLAPELFLEPKQIVRMGLPPMRIEVLTEIDGVDFEDAFVRRTQAAIGDLTVNMISREHLIANKRASGRHKDLADLDYLE